MTEVGCEACKWLEEEADQWVEITSDREELLEKYLQPKEHSWGIDCMYSQIINHVPLERKDLKRLDATVTVEDEGFRRNVSVQLESDVIAEDADLEMSL